jgi:hypothetical protein
MLTSARLQTWCWISEDWSALRIYTCYMLVWVCILTSLVIYAGIGFYLFQTRSKSTEASEDGSRGRESDRLAPSDYTHDRVCASLRLDYGRSRPVVSIGYGID